MPAHSRAPCGSDPRKDLSDLIDEIGRIQAALDQLTQKRVELEGFIHTHEALLSPMRRLPDDTLRDIFLAALPSGLQYSTLSAADPPLLLCHVSQRWRSLALSTPWLGASLHIALPPIEDSRTAHSPKLGEIDDAVKDWLSRSGSLPLSISFVVHRSGSGHYHMEQLVAIFVQQSRRWKSIRLDFPSHNLLAGFEVLSPADVPLLRSAIISGFASRRLGGFSFRSEGRPYLSFLGTPNLKRLSVNQGHYPNFSVRWGALQHVFFQGIGLWPDRALELLRQCPALETCTVFINISHTSEAVVPRPCHLLHLQRLSIADNSRLTTRFFQCLVIPNLRCLEYSYLGRTSPPDLWPCFSVLPSTPYALIAGLRLVPTLKELRVFGEPLLLNNSSKFPEYDPRLVPLLLSKDPILCPHLQRITLARFSAVSDAALLAFLLARTDPSLPVDDRLTSARLDIIRSPDTDIRLIPALQQRITDGLQLSVEYEVLSGRIHHGRASNYLTSRTIRNQDESHDWDPVSSDRA
ncbi:hypothetical protein C8R45DRAFT_1087713 [Mycena sanguinolenta]|nr:hypothetical protein C8R45DRAFT_1087713 [Mycena sanguinolenta]